MDIRSVTPHPDWLRLSASPLATTQPCRAARGYVRGRERGRKVERRGGKVRVQSVADFRDTSKSAVCDEGEALCIGEKRGDGEGRWRGEER